MRGVIIQESTKNNITFWAGILSVGIFLGLIYLLAPILTPFIIGFIGAYAFRKPVEWLEKIHISRAVASFLIVAGLIFLVVILIVIAIPYLQSQLILLAANVPQWIEATVTKLSPVLQNFSEQYGGPDLVSIKTQITSQLGNVLNWMVHLLTNLLTSSVALANLISVIFLTPLLMFYLLKDWPALVYHVNRLIPPAYAPRLNKYANRIDQTLSSYVKGQALVCCILMILYSAALTMAGLPGGPFIGVLTGFMSFIPYVGALLGFMASMGVSFAHFGDWSSIGVVAFLFFMVSLIESYFLTPRFIGSRVGLNPVWIIFSLLAGANCFGFIGVLFALPAAATLGVIVNIGVEIYRSSSFFKPLKGKKKHAKA